jgi:hypothetical protein
MRVATIGRSREELVERRTFFGALAGASLSVVSECTFTEFARAQSSVQAGVILPDQGSFEVSQVEVSGNTIFLRRYGKGPAILLVHGFPRTGLMWRFRQTVHLCVRLESLVTKELPDPEPKAGYGIADWLVLFIPKGNRTGYLKSRRCENEKVDNSRHPCCCDRGFGRMVCISA